MSETQDFAGRVVLITGAGRGLGRTVALDFARRGATLALNDVTPINLDETLDEARRAGARAGDYVFDVSKKMPVQALIEAVRDDFGRLDVLVNAAEVEPIHPVLTMDEWDWRRVVDVDLNAAFFLLQSAARVMQAAGGGVIVQLVSAGPRPGGMAKRAAFLSARLGLVGLTRVAAHELAEHDVRVHAVFSGLPAELRAELGGQPAGEYPDPVTAVQGLCSPEAADLNGQILWFDAE